MKKAIQYSTIHDPKYRMVVEHIPADKTSTKVWFWVTVVTATVLVAGKALHKW